MLPVLAIIKIRTRSRSKVSVMITTMKCYLLNGRAASPLMAISSSDIASPSAKRYSKESFEFKIPNLHKKYDSSNVPHDMSLTTKLHALAGKQSMILHVELSP